MNLDATFWAVAAVLALFGVGYDRLVEWMEAHGYDDGYTAFLVVGGVLATQAGLAVWFGVELAIKATLLFIASGTPMIIGSMARHGRQRAEDAARVKQELHELLEKKGDGDRATTA